MKKRTLLFSLLLASNVNAESSVPESVELKSKFQFDIRDNTGKLNFGRYLKSASEITSATSCQLTFSADDDFYNTYSGELSLITDDDGFVLPFFQIKSLYIDEKSRYWAKEIDDVIYKTGTLTASKDSWQQDTIKRTHFLFAPTIDHAQLAFHQITMGQPLHVDMKRKEAPYNVSIKVEALSATYASLVRKCIKLMDENTSFVAKEKAPIRKRSVEKSQELNPEVKYAVSDAFQIYQNGKIDEAILALKEIKTFTIYETAYVSRFIGVLMAMSGQHNLQAITYLEQATEQAILKHDDHIESLKLLADLQLQEAQYSDALQSYNSWLKLSGNDRSSIQDRLDKINEQLSN